MRSAARLQIHPRVRLPLRIQERERYRRSRSPPSPMSNNHYGLLRASNSDENISNTYVPDYLSTCDDNSVASSSSFYEFCDVTALLKQIETLYLSDQCCSDVTLKVENERFPAHKVILSCRSTYFRAMFFGGLKEQKENEVELQDVPIAAFKALLKYIYSGRIRFQTLKFDVILDIFALCHRWGFGELENALCDYLKHILHFSNVVSIYSMAHFYTLNDLLNSCMDFIDKESVPVLQTEGFLQLPGPSLYSIFRRNSFCAPEIMIFNLVVKWIQQHPDEVEHHKELLDCVRLPLIKIEDLLGIVRPTGLIESDKLLDVINDQTSKKSTDLIFRGVKLINTNCATQTLNAHVIEGENSDHLLRNTTQRADVDKCTRHDITENEKRSVIIELGTAYLLNHIELCLLDRDQRGYFYYVEVSMDQKDWVRIIDHTKYLCRSIQKLFFNERVVKYIKICGTRATGNRIFYLSSIKAMFTNETFTIDPETTLLKPKQNVTTIANNSNVIEGVSRSRNSLINGESEQYDWDVGYTCHQIPAGNIVIQLAQPYLIDSMRLLLWDCDDRSYSFEIDVSCDHQFWEPVIKAHELRSWQSFKFQPIPVVFIRITGTFNTANEVFHIVHFECPAKAGIIFNFFQLEPESGENKFPMICGTQNLSLVNLVQETPEISNGTDDQ